MAVTPFFEIFEIAHKEMEETWDRVEVMQLCPFRYTMKLDWTRGSSKRRYLHHRDIVY